MGWLHCHIRKTCYYYLFIFFFDNECCLRLTTRAQGASSSTPSEDWTARKEHLWRSKRVFDTVVLDSDDNTIYLLSTVGSENLSKAVAWSQTLVGAKAL